MSHSKTIDDGGHTPGPWQAEFGHMQTESRIQYWQVTDGVDAICCNQFCYAGNAHANAHLIAAAPDLLEAAKAEEEADQAFETADEATHRADAEGWLNDPTGSLHVNAAWSRANDLRAKAKELRVAAIAKAEGRAALSSTEGV